MSDNEKRIPEEELGTAAGGASYEGYFTYTVVYGDTLGNIASRFRTTATALAALPKMQDMTTEGQTEVE